MSWKVYFGLALIWLAFVLIDATLWGGYATTRAGDAHTDINILFSPPIATATTTWGMISGVIAIPEYILAWFKLLWWDFTFLDGSAQILRYVMIALSLGVIGGFMQAWIRGVRA